MEKERGYDLNWLLVMPKRCLSAIAASTLAILSTSTIAARVQYSDLAIIYQIYLSHSRPGKCVETLRLVSHTFRRIFAVTRDQHLGTSSRDTSRGPILRRRKAHRVYCSDCGFLKVSAWPIDSEVKSAVTNGTVSIVF